MQPCIYFNILYLGMHCSSFFCFAQQVGRVSYLMKCLHARTSVHAKQHTRGNKTDQRPIKVKESKTDQSYPIKKWHNFDCTWSNLNRTWGNFNQPVKVTPSVNKDINCHFFGIFFGMKNMWGNAWIKKAKYI